MDGMSRGFLAWSGCWFTFLFALAVEQSSADEKSFTRASTEVYQLEQEFRERLLAEEVLVEKYAPLLPSSAVRSQELVVISGVWYPLRLEIVALDVDGHPIPLAEQFIKPQRSLTVSVADALGDNFDEFSGGALRLSYRGTPSSVQAWLMVEADDGQDEIQLTSRGEAASNRDRLVWNFDGRSDSIRFLMTNMAPSPIRVQLGDDRLVVDSEASRTIDVAEPVGDIMVEHSGDAGDLLLTGLARGSGVFDFMKVLQAPAELSQKLYEAHSLPVPSDAQAARVSVVASSGATQVTFDTVPLSGNPTSPQMSLRACAGCVEHTVVPVVPGQRLVVRSDRPIQLQGHVIRDDFIEDLHVFEHHLAHGSGDYPFFSLETHEMTTTWINLSDEAARVVAQVTWNGGEYAFGPIGIAPGATHRQVWNDLVGHSPDVLGRTLAADTPSGHLSWRVFGGTDRQLLARTEASSKTSSGSVGFNCFGCCYEIPNGEIVPTYVEVLPGQSVAFQACKTIQTCTGTLGPYPISPSGFDIPWPFGWNGSLLSVSAAAEEVITFSASDWMLDTKCQSGSRTYTGSGRGSSCKKLLERPGNSSWDIARACTQQVGGATNACSSCQSCCSAQKSYNQCKRKSPAITQSEYNACIGSCLSDHC